MNPDVLEPLLAHWRWFFDTLHGYWLAFITDAGVFWPNFFDLLYEGVGEGNAFLRAIGDTMFDWLWALLFSLWLGTLALWPGLDGLWLSLTTVMTGERAPLLISVSIKILLGFVLARAARSAIIRGFGRRVSQQQLMILRRAVSYAIVALFSFSVLRDLGFDFAVLLGAAGILTVAIGFASQTSASNLISGLFLIAERTIEIGDVIEVDKTLGVVMSVDLLSTKLRTFDNLYMRIPNETMVKSKIVNLTRLPLRRIDIKFSVAYKEKIGKVRDVLMRVADKNPLSLEEPKPFLFYQGYGDSGIELQFSVWAVRQNFLELKNSILLEIKEALDEAGIEIPFPHLTLYTGTVTEPFPVEFSRAPKAESAPIIVPDEYDIPERPKANGHSTAPAPPLRIEADAAAGETEASFETGERPEPDDRLEEEETRVPQASRT